MEKPQPRDRRAFGEALEKIAARYLHAQGLSYVCSNFQCKVGEIDLIMRSATELVFVEVRYRRSLAFGTPAETVNRRKQRKLVRAAQYYLSTRQLTNHVRCRFDVLGISPAGQSHELHFDWIQGAFQVS